MSFSIIIILKKKKKSLHSSRKPFYQINVVCEGLVQIELNGAVHILGWGLQVWMFEMRTSMHTSMSKMLRE